MVIIIIIASLLGVVGGPLLICCLCGYCCGRCQVDRSEISPTIVNIVPDYMIAPQSPQSGVVSAVPLSPIRHPQQPQQQPPWQQWQQPNNNFPYRVQLRLLYDMGMIKSAVDEQMCKALLVSNGGNLELVVQWLTDSSRTAPAPPADPYHPSNLPPLPPRPPPMHASPAPYPIYQN